MSKEEVEKYVSVGDSVTRERDLVEMGDCVNVKSLDNPPGATIAYLYSGTPAHDQVSHLGAGAAIKLYDGSVIADRRMVKFMKAMADANKIKWQTEMLPAGGSTDAGAMQNSFRRFHCRGHFRSTRNVHQVIEMAPQDDLDASVALLTACTTERVDKLELRQRNARQEKTRQGRKNGSKPQSRCRKIPNNRSGIHSSPGEPHRKQAACLFNLL